MTEVAGKTVYITGAGSGMGLLAGKMLAGLGAHIVTLDRTPNDAALHQIESARRSPEQRVARYKVDVADREMVIGTVERQLLKLAHRTFSLTWPVSAARRPR